MLFRFPHLLCDYRYFSQSQSVSASPRQRPGSAQASQYVTAPFHSLSQLPKYIVAIGVGRSGCRLPNQPFVEHTFEVPLQSSAVDLGKDTFQVAQRQPAAGEQMIQRSGLTRIEPMRLRHHVSSNGDLTARLNLFQLYGQPVDEKPSQPVRSMPCSRTP